MAGPGYPPLIPVFLSVIAGGVSILITWMWLICLSGTWTGSWDPGGGGQRLYQVGSVTTQGLCLLNIKVGETYVSQVLVFCSSFQRGYWSWLLVGAEP